MHSLIRSASRTPGPRSKEDTHPGRISQKRTVATPMRSEPRGVVGPASQYADRKGSGIPQQAQESQEAKAGNG